MWGKGKKAASVSILFLLHIISVKMLLLSLKSLKNFQLLGWRNNDIESQAIEVTEPVR